LKRLRFAAVLVLAVLLAGCIGRFLYYPARKIETTPRDVGLHFESVRFSSADGIRLSAWWLPAGNERGVLIFCHGNGGNISHRLDSLLIFNRLGLSTLILDYRGYGLSGGRPTEEGTYLDADAAWTWLVRNKGISPGRIVIFGRSLGGAVASRLARDRSHRALILESSFTSVPDMIRDLYPWAPTAIAAGYRYGTIDHIRNLQTPVLFIHSPADEIVPFAHGRRLYESFPGRKCFLEIKGSHNRGFLDSRADYERGLDRFLTESAGMPRRNRSEGK